jgi:hypothetical protein
MGIMDMEDFPSTTKTDGMISISVFTALTESVLFCLKVYYTLSLLIAATIYVMRHNGFG